LFLEHDPQRSKRIVDPGLDGTQWDSQYIRGLVHRTIPHDGLGQDLTVRVRERTQRFCDYHLAQGLLRSVSDPRVLRGVPNGAPVSIRMSRHAHDMLTLITVAAHRRVHSKRKLP
jgi:hypothetical protein